MKAVDRSEKYKKKIGFLLPVIASIITKVICLPGCTAYEIQRFTAPLTDSFVVGKPQVQTNPGGATLTVFSRFKPEINGYAWLEPTFMQRDLLFLTLDPSLFIVAFPELSLTFMQYLVILIL